MKVNYIKTYLMNPLDDEVMVKIPKDLRVIKKLDCRSGI